MSQRPPDNLPYCNGSKHAQIPIPTQQDNSSMDSHSITFRPDLNREPTMNADSQQTSRHLLNLFSMVNELQHEVHELRRENHGLAARHAEDTKTLRQDNHALANLILKTNKETREYIRRHGYTGRGSSRVVVVPDAATTSPVNQPRRYKKKTTTTTNPTVHPNRELINLGISDINSSNNNERHLRSGREVPSPVPSPPAPVTPVPLVNPNNNMNNSATTVNNEEEEEKIVVVENLSENEESKKRPNNDEENENSNIKSSKKRNYQKKR